MRLNEKDKIFLKNRGYSTKDIETICYAARKTIYFLILGNEKRDIEEKRAYEALGREAFLTGIAFAAFNWTCRRMADTGETIYFDSTPAWK